MWWWWCWCCENAGHLKMKICSWSVPLLILLHHDQSELLFLRKDRYWPRFGHFLCIPGNPAGQFWAKRKVRSFGCPRTQGFLKEWNGLFYIYNGLFYDFDAEKHHILVMNLMRWKMTRNTCRCEAKRVFRAIFPKNDMSLHSVYWQLTMEIKIVMLESLISHCQSRPQWPL